MLVDYYNSSIINSIPTERDINMKLSYKKLRSRLVSAEMALKSELAPVITFASTYKLRELLNINNYTNFSFYVDHGDFMCFHEILHNGQTRITDIEDCPHFYDIFKGLSSY